MQSISENILKIFLKIYKRFWSEPRFFVEIPCIPTAHAFLMYYLKHRGFLDQHKDWTIESLDPTLSNLVIFEELNQINFREINRSFILTNTTWSFNEHIQIIRNKGYSKPVILHSCP